MSECHLGRREDDIVVGGQDPQVIDGGRKQRARHQRHASRRLPVIEVHPPLPAVVGSPDAGVPAQIQPHARGGHRDAQGLAGYGLTTTDPLRLPDGIGSDCALG